MTRNTPISEVEMSGRLHNICIYNNILTIGELVTMPERNLLQLRNFGHHTLDEVRKLKSALPESELTSKMSFSFEKYAEILKNERAKTLSEQWNFDTLPIINGDSSGPVLADVGNSYIVAYYNRFAGWTDACDNKINVKRWMYIPR